MPRSVDLAVISDVHLGTPSCKAEALLGYLDDLRPAELVLNGDIVDLRELRRGFWPAAHTEVMRRLLAFAADGVPVHYVTGNHDHVLRLFSSFKAGSIHLVDHLERNLGGRRTWFLHGDLIEKGMGTPALLRAAGCVAYKLLRGAERAN
ncbi:MAG: metallophosphoesterase family protein, partial [Planctomycetes bacterium]|nr:metallophosphoesterase family protein [Planctomycetota bacterium]